MSRASEGVPKPCVSRGGPPPREYQLPIVRELYPSWHPLAGREIDPSSASARAPRLRQPLPGGAAAPIA
jgi:hypothetical protein